MGRLSRRVARLAACLDPVPDAQFLAYARAVIAWGGGEPTEARACALALALQRTRQGATWTGLMALAEEEADEAPLVDPPRQTPTEREEAGRLAAMSDDGGLASLSGEDLDLVECLRRKLDGLADGPCRA